MQTPVKFDFHCHSTASDGTLPPVALVERAHAQGVQWLALTDHDTLAGLPAASARAAELNMRFTRGVELSTSWHAHTIHIIGLDIDPNNAALAGHTAHILKLRAVRAKKIGDKLTKLGIPGIYEAASALSQNDRPGRPHFARALCECGAVKDEAQAFQKLLGSGKPAYVSAAWPAIDEACRLILGAGGVPVMAHPLRYKVTATKLRALLAEFKAAGGAGMEVLNGFQNADETALAVRYLHKYQFLASAGSDFHTPMDQKSGNHHGPELGHLPALAGILAAATAPQLVLH